MKRNKQGNSYKHHNTDNANPPNFEIHKYRNGQKISRKPVSPNHKGYKEWIGEPYNNTPEVVAYVAPDPYAANLDDAKTKKVKELKSIARGKISEGDWLIIRSIRNPLKTVPQSEKDRYNSIISQADAHESAINALATVDSVANYAITWA